jgi:glucose/arabinose dehydrogenase
VLLAALIALPGASQAAETLTVPAGFSLEVLAHVPYARELAVTPDGDLFVGTSGKHVMLVPNAEGDASTPVVFATMGDAPAAGVALDRDALFVGTQFGVWRIPYRAGDRVARHAPVEIAAVRTSGISRDHHTTSLALSGGRLFVSVGSSCNACDPEVDSTRATIQVLELPAGRLTPKAIHIRNAIALAVNPASGDLWAGVAGQDELAHDHPYEMFDDVTAHHGVADYGWPYCYENRRATRRAHSCSDSIVPRVVFPAYETPIGAVFYPLDSHGRYAFGAPYNGGAFVTLHGSWHQPPQPPRVVFIPMRDDQPLRPVNWDDARTQWDEFLENFQLGDGTRVGRPTGIAVGPQGSLFIADDDAGVIYRIRRRAL